MTKRRGKLIVLDGTDGSGKATQTALLLKRLRKEGQRIATLDFPQYEKSMLGGLLGRYLRGDFGKPIHPYLISAIYAAERWESKEKILRWLREGRVVVLDRYVSANQIHQGSRVGNSRERRKFLAWLLRLEHGVFGLPRPDMVVFLHVPARIAMVLAKNKNARRYVGGKKRDQMERDRKHQEETVRTGLALAKTLANWKKIECVRNGDILPRKKIHERIFNAIRPVIGKGRR